ncbi:MAG: carboxypeptidase regulatory-like domain-containing protein [Opitutaceae bacterium]
MSTIAFGQGVTTGAISGTVVDKQGQPAEGALVTALLADSGTRATAITRANGEYTLVGLRPGGPYTLSATSKGMTAEAKTGIFVDAGQQYSGSDTQLVLSSEVVTMEAVSVESTKDTTFNAGAMSNALNLGYQDVGQIATIRRDVQDIQNLDPRAAVMQVSPTDSQYTVSFDGQNPRENLFLIDGVSANDNFGLNSNGYAGFRSPLPIDWIQGISIDLNPYDLIYSGFSGGITNATTMSGTNTYHGSIYELYAGTDFRGPDPVVGALGAHEAMNEHTTGLTFGGPIIKNKLFFFLGYEAFREIASPPAQQFLPDNSGGVISQVISTTETNYGFNPGSLTAVNHVWDQNFIGKINWNISDTQKFEFTFRHTAGEAPNFYNYTGTYYTSLSSSWYNTYRTDQSYTAKLISDWSQYIPNFHTELEATYRRYNGTARLNGSDFPAVEVNGVPGTSLAGASPPNFLYLGQYWAYQNNNIYTWEQEEHAYGEYSIGDHTIKFGAQFERDSYTDTFIPNILGTYYFDSVAEYQAGTPTFAEQETPYPGYTLGSDVSHYYQLTLSPLVEDTWRPSSALTVTYGLRLDYPYEPQDPPYSLLFNNTYGYRNNSNGNGNYIFSPRVGFNYQLPTGSSGLKTQIRGGAGLIVGTFPVVWYENSFNNAGQLNTVSAGSTSQSATTATIKGATGTPDAGQPFIFNGLNTPALTNYAVPSASVPSFDVIDPKFKAPSNWKENIAIDRDLPWWKLIFTANIDLMQVNTDAAVYNLNLKQATSGPAYLPDGAIAYAGNITPGLSSSTFSSSYPQAAFSAMYPTSTFKVTSLFNSVSSSTSVLSANPATGGVYYLTNTDQGAAQDYSLEIHRPMIDGWAFELAYAHTHATQVDPAPSSVASSGYADIYSVNPNDNVAGRSQYAVPDRVVLTGTKQFKFFHAKHSETQISLQFLEQTGQAYSYVFKGDGDGRGITGTSLMYVPTGPSDPKVEWANPTDEANFFAWLAEPTNHELASYAGRIAPRNAFYAPWQRTLNLHIEQNVPIWGPGYVTLFADCFNFGNLINKNWGVVDDWDNAFESRTAVGAAFDPSGNGGAGSYVYTYNNGTVTNPTIYSDMSRWFIQVGARLKF